MKREKALEKISLVKRKKTEDYIQQVLIRIEDYINTQKLFSYQDTMNFIQEQMSCKLGGRDAYINKALEFLKNELKTEYKKSKKGYCSECGKKLKKIDLEMTQRCEPHPLEEPYDGKHKKVFFYFCNNCDINTKNTL